MGTAGSSNSLTIRNLPVQFSNTGKNSDRKTKKNIIKKHPQHKKTYEKTNANQLFGGYVMTVKKKKNSIQNESHYINPSIYIWANKNLPSLINKREYVNSVALAEFSNLPRKETEMIKI